MTITTELLVSIFASLGTAAGAYAAIRYDLGRLHEKANQAASAADEAHRRIDRMLTK